MIMLERFLKITRDDENMYNTPAILAGVKRNREVSGKYGDRSVPTELRAWNIQLIAYPALRITRSIV
jgi:hypothetical protein